jgi:hypothetical protein
VTTSFSDQRLERTRDEPSNHRNHHLGGIAAGQVEGDGVIDQYF